VDSIVVDRGPVTHRSDGDGEVLGRAIAALGRASRLLERGDWREALDVELGVLREAAAREGEAQRALRLEALDGAGAGLRRAHAQARLRLDRAAVRRGAHGGELTERLQDLERRVELERPPGEPEAPILEGHFFSGGALVTTLVLGEMGALGSALVVKLLPPLVGFQSLIEASFWLLGLILFGVAWLCSGRFELTATALQWIPRIGRSRRIALAALTIKPEEVFKEGGVLIALPFHCLDPFTLWFVKDADKLLERIRCENTA
jgi:hypothetical protein